MSNTQSFRVAQNSIFPRCVDGRLAEVFISWNDDQRQWQVEKRAEEARLENGPQFLGASLVFVKALEEVADLDRERAFELTQEASKAVGLGLQIHLDDHHGEHSLSSLTEAELISLIEHHHEGCGFAKFAWGEEGSAIIAKAKTHHWRIQLLVGHHEETGAVVNYIDKETFDTALAVQNKVSKFNTNVATARQVFEALEEILDRPGFAHEAEEWMLDTYTKVVIALKGVTSPEEIETIE